MTESQGATGKGRPTPKRRDAQKGAARGRPVGPPPATRKEAAKRIRQQGAAKRKAVKAGTAVGDEANMMARDQGPVRRLVRDMVDARRHIGVLLLPAALLPIIAQLSGSAAVLRFATTLWFATLLAAISDFVITGVLVRRRIRADFPDESKTRGHVGYAMVRTAQFRRFRLPPPRVGPGDTV
jgi:hypothetical protein